VDNPREHVGITASRDFFEHIFAPITLGKGMWGQASGESAGSLGDKNVLVLFQN
jgi:hypothetical protein